MSDHPAPTKARIWAESISSGTCKGCGKPVTWAQLCRSGKKMPFDRLEVLNHGEDDQTGKQFQTVSLRLSHFASCPEARNFRGGGAASSSAPNVAQAIVELKQAQAHLRKQYLEQPSREVVGAGQAIGRALTFLEATR